MLKELEDDLAKGKKKDTWKFSLALHLRRFKLNNNRGKKIQSALKDASEKEDDDEDIEIEAPKEVKPEVKAEKKDKVKKVKSKGGESSSSSSDEESDKEKKKSGFGLGGLKLSLGGKVSEISRNLL